MKLTAVIVGGLAMAMALSACSGGGLFKGKSKSKGIAFDGIEFKMSAKAVDKDRMHFYATAKPVSKGLAPAMAAAEYTGIDYCINNYGTSDIDWVVGPETDPTQFVYDKDALRFEGRCDI